MSELRYVEVDNWAAVYVDGECRFQNHQIDPDIWLGLLKQGPFVVPEGDFYDWAQDYVDEFDEFPDSWAELEEWRPENGVSS